MIEGPFKLSPTEEELDMVISGFSENRAAEISALCREFASRSAAKKQKYLRIIPTIVLLWLRIVARLRATWNWAARLHHVEVERAGQTAAGGCGREVGLSETTDRVKANGALPGSLLRIEMNRKLLIGSGPHSMYWPYLGFLSIEIVGHLDAMGVVHEPIEDAMGQNGIGDLLMAEVDYIYSVDLTRPVDVRESLVAAAHRSTMFAQSKNR